MRDDTLAIRLQKMRDILRSLKRVAVAFSGGVDSTFVLRVAVDTLGRENVLAVTGRSASVASGEFDDAVRLAATIGAEHVILDTHEFEDANYLANPANRCYYCKTELYSRMAPLVAARGFRAIVNGTNANDLGDYRPGLTAAKEHNVRAPAAEVGLTKADIRALSAQMGLPTHDKPAAPCLSSRVQYGEAITPEKLRMIERAETVLRDLGFRECRVRHHDKLARIEVPAADIERLASEDVRARIDEAFREIGYQYITLDLRGFRSGSMNEVIAFGVRQAAR
ncbi:MAG: ATP-dependent sacrificial sulfur transferase LarE [Planctomycetota bacterium]|nr:MAG: ATP-dependent sacrificial sulfur transferase LarE [Planctomycetota bacterium]